MKTQTAIAATLALLAALSAASSASGEGREEYFQVAYLIQDDVILHTEVDDGTDPREMLVLPEGEKFGLVSAPRQRRLAMFLRPPDQHRPFVYVHDIDSGEGRKLHQLAFRSARPLAFSPDGSWVAFVDKEDTEGKQTLHAASFDGKKNLTICRDKDIWDGPAFGDADTVLLGTVTTTEMDQELLACSIRGLKQRTLLKSCTIPEGMAQERLRPSYTPLSLDAHPKSGRILWLDWGDKSPSILQVRTTGLRGGPDRFLTESGKSVVAASFSPDGKRIAFFVTGEAIGTDDLFVMKSDGRDLKRIATVNKQSYRGWMFTWSPDSRRLAYVHNATKTPGAVREIYIVDADDGEPRRLTSNQACECDPVWLLEAQR